MNNEYYDQDGIMININRRRKITKKISAVTPLLAVVAFLVLGLFFDAWHPGWTVFFCIPVVEIFLKIFIREGKAKWVSIATIVSIIAYIGLSIYTGWWLKLWVVFFIIPITAIIAD